MYFKALYHMEFITASLYLMGWNKVGCVNNFYFKYFHVTGAFDLLIYTKPDCEVPEQWGETEPVFIANSQELQMRSFSTSLHRMHTIVSYKAE